MAKNGKTPIWKIVLIVFVVLVVIGALGSGGSDEPSSAPADGGTAPLRRRRIQSPNQSPMFPLNTSRRSRRRSRIPS